MVEENAPIGSIDPVLPHPEVDDMAKGEVREAMASALWQADPNNENGGTWAEWLAYSEKRLLLLRVTARYYAMADAALAQPITEQPSPVGEGIRDRVAEVIADDGGCWRACSGCQESNEGYVSEQDYPYNPIFQCQPGGGCYECGGIGVVWESGAYLDSFADAFTATPPSDDAARIKVLEEALEQAEQSFDRIRLILLHHLEEPERQAFWAAAVGKTNARAALGGPHDR